MEVANIRTRDDLIAWIKAHVPEEYIRGTPEKEADWFLVSQEARQIKQTMSEKDLAQCLFDGTFTVLAEAYIGSGEAHKAFFDGIFCLVDDPEYDHDDHPEDAVQDLTNMLNVHFKLEEERDINDEG
jgi:hypothetical protein